MEPKGTNLSPECTKSRHLEIQTLPPSPRP